MASLGVNIAGQKVLVTGAAGFIGRHLVNALLRAGAHVCASTRTGESFSPDVVSEGKLESVALDVTKASSAESVIESFSPQVIYNLAAYFAGSDSADEVQRQMDVMLGGTVVMVSAALKNNLPLFVHLGTCMEYGNGPVPFTEEQDTIAVSHYADVKINATNYLHDVGANFGLPIINLRPSVVYGPGQRRQLIPYLFESYLRGIAPRLTAGEQTRDYLYIDDLIRALVLCAGNVDLAGNVINIASGVDYTIKELAGLAANIAHYTGDLGLGQLPYRQSEVMKYVARNDRASRLLSWQPEVPLEDGLRHTAEWWREQVRENGATILQ